MRGAGALLYFEYGIVSHVFDNHQVNLTTKLVVISKWTFISGATDNQKVISQEYLDSPYKDFLNGLPRKHTFTC